MSERLYPAVVGRSVHPAVVGRGVHPAVLMPLRYPAVLMSLRYPAVLRVVYTQRCGHSEVIPSGVVTVRLYPAVFGQ